MRSLHVSAGEKKDLMFKSQRDQEKKLKIILRAASVAGQDLREWYPSSKEKGVFQRGDN